MRMMGFLVVLALCLISMFVTSLILKRFGVKFRHFWGIVFLALSVRAGFFIYANWVACAQLTYVHVKKAPVPIKSVMLAGRNHTSLNPLEPRYIEGTECWNVCAELLVRGLVDSVELSQTGVVMGKIPEDTPVYQYRIVSSDSGKCERRLSVEYRAIYKSREDVPIIDEACVGKTESQTIISTHIIKNVQENRYVAMHPYHISRTTLFDSQSRGELVDLQWANSASPNAEDGDNFAPGFFGTLLMPLMRQCPLAADSIPQDSLFEVEVLMIARGEMK